jgi:polysaccharide biosynthesis protein PslH
LKILYLLHRVPYPLNDGGALGVDAIIKGLLGIKSIKLSIIALNTTKHYVNLSSLPSYYKQLHFFKTIDINNNIKPTDALLNLFLSNKSYNVSRFASNTFNNVVEKFILEAKPDVVFIDNIYLENVIPVIPNGILKVCRIHNIEHLIWKQLAANSKNIFIRTYLQIQSKRLYKDELAALNKCDALVPVNINEVQLLEKMGVHKQILSFPFGIDIQPLKPVNICADIFFIASMDWLPNVEALDWFLQDVWPFMKASYPTLIFHIAGKHLPNKYFSNIDKQIKVYKNVEDATAFTSTKGICIVPLLSGAGIRVKIIQNFALGIPTISTTIGAAGIAINSKNILIANTASEFVQAYKLAIKNFEDISKKANATALEYYNINTNANNFYNQLQQLVLKHG